MSKMKIEPKAYYDNGAIPIFEPSLEEFKDFKAFMTSIEDYGRKAGIVKIIPPKEWQDQLPNIEKKLKDVHIAKPITQHILGGRGIFTQTNIEDRKAYSIDDWYQLCQHLDHRPPPLDSKYHQQVDFESKYSHLSTDQYKEIERNYWRNITFNQPKYGADMLGTLFDESVKEWNPNTLDNILHDLHVTLPGVNRPYLYFGMWKATFAWHVEDMDLYSINYIHFGAPKQWYVIPPSQQKKFESFMQATFFTQYKSCHEFLRHKTFIVSPKVLQDNNISVQRCVQQPGEFMVTFPYGYHSGYNLDFNCAESVNFALESWIQIGQKAQSCHCISDSVTIDVASLFPSTIEPIRKKRKRTKKTDCLLCSMSYPDALVTAKGQDVHKICAEAVGETWIQDSVVYGVERIPSSRWKLVCIYCKQKTGACMQCCHGKCWKSFHVTCALQHQATVDKVSNYDPSQPYSQFNAYCPQHDPQRLIEKKALDEHYIKEMSKKFQLDLEIYTKWRGGGFYPGKIKECIPSQKMCRVVLQDGVIRKVPWRDISLSPPSTF
ncbi:JmjC domain, hydroxylase-domain-containing protein [Choanephora cucurbitarum]|nr:JmjC domain, hydroxylase-domain-containing protein [Choanephora cucurbitarum]